MCLCFNNSSVSISSPFLFRSSSLSFVFNCFYCFCLSSPALRDKAPGQRECDSSIDNINKCIRDIEQASLAAVSQNLPSRDDISLEVSDHGRWLRIFADDWYLSIFICLFGIYLISNLFLPFSSSLIVSCFCLFSCILNLSVLNLFLWY